MKVPKNGRYLEREREREREKERRKREHDLSGLPVVERTKKK